MSIPSVTTSLPPIDPSQVAGRPTPAQNAAVGNSLIAGVGAAGTIEGSRAAPLAHPADAVQRAHATQEPDRETLLQAVQEVRNAIKPVAQDLRFSIDDDTGRTVVKVVDSTTDEVIRQIPSKELLAISKALDKLQGVLIKQEA